MQAKIFSDDTFAEQLVQSKLLSNFWIQLVCVVDYSYYKHFDDQFSFMATSIGLPFKFQITHFIEVYLAHIINAAGKQFNDNINDLKINIKLMGMIISSVKILLNLN